MDDQARFESDELLLVRRNPWVMALAASPALISLAALIAGFSVRKDFFAGLFHPAFLAAALTMVAWRKNWRPRIDPVRVTADAAGVHVGDRFIPRAEIRDGLVLPGNPPQVKLTRRWGLPVLLQTNSYQEARGLLRALGLDASQTVATFRTRSRAVARRRNTAGIVAIFMGIYGGFIGGMVNVKHHPTAGGFAAAFFVLGLTAMMTVLLMPARLSVGADGIALTWFGRKRFIGYGDIDSVSRYDRSWGRSRQLGLTVALRSGEEVTIPVGQARWDEEHVAAIQERMREAMETFRSGGGAADAAHLRRGGRAVSAWVESLRAIGAGANADLRTAPIPRDRLFRIVESPTAGAADRAAAAVALGGDLDAEGRARLANAAAASAAPKLRIVLEATAEGRDHAALEEALAELDEDERASAKA